MGAEIANKCKKIVSAYFPDPTEVINVVTDTDDDDVMVVKSN
jgi:hypothetical protein